MRYVVTKPHELLVLLSILWLLAPATALAQNRRERDRRDDQSQENQSPSAPSEDEQKAVAILADKTSGVVVYSRNNHIRKQTIGDYKAIDLGTGEAARWSPDGTKIAVFDDEDILIMNADGSNRKRLCGDADSLEDGCPIEFHTNGKEILFARKRTGLWVVGIDDGVVRQLELPGRYTGEPNLSADGTRLTARIDNDLYAVDLVQGKHRKYAKGCGPCVSPSGKWLVNNIGSHRQLSIQRWDGSDLRRIDANKLRPDRGWDDFHWSNHEDLIVVQGEKSSEEAYVIDVSSGNAVRVTWEGRIRNPDLYAAKAGFVSSTPSQ